MINMKKYCVGVDVGGTTVKLGLFDIEVTMLSAWEIPTVTENNGERILPDVAKTIEDKLQELSISKEEVSGIGVGVPGAVDTNGIVNTAVNLGWGVLDIPAILGELTGIQVKEEKDAKLPAHGEMREGGGVGI